MSRQNALQLASLFINIVKNEGITVKKAFLFGSWAKGTADENSDIDICVISPEFGIDYTDEMAKLLTIAQKVDSRIESIPFNQKDILDPYSSLASEIRTTGVEIPVITTIAQ